MAYNCYGNAIYRSSCLAYTKDDFDYDASLDLAEMAAEIMSEYVDLPVEKVKLYFAMRLVIKHQN